MKQNRRQDLLQKYIQSQISPKEFVRLKRIHKENDRLLAEDLEMIWQSYTGPQKQNKEAFNQILRSLQKEIRPVQHTFTIRRLWKITAAVAASLLLFTTSYLLVERQKINTAAEKEYFITVNKGEKATVVLPDGSKVYLNSESTLSYPASFAWNKRTAKLMGEGYFEVQYNKDSPFVIFTPQAKVKVLGTTFNLNAYPAQEWFEASLVEGRIEVTSTSRPDKTTELSPNQKLRYNPVNGEWQVSSTDLRTETAWHRGDLIFRSQTPESVFKKLGSFYGMNIRLQGNMPDLSFTGSYHENDINVVLKNLQLHYPFTYTKVGSEIYITFNH